MANAINTNFDFTYDGIQTTEVLVKPAVMHPDVASLFRVIPGITSKHQLNLLTQLGKTVKGGQDCGVKPTTTGGPASITNRELEVSPLQMELEQCGTALIGTVMERTLAKGNAENDITGADIEGIVNEVVSESLSSELFRIFSFGDKTSGINDYYNMSDGLFTKLEEASATYEVNKIAISSLDTGSNSAIAHLRTAYTESEIVLKQLPADKKAFFVSGVIFENLMTMLEEKAFAGGLVQRLEKGVPSLTFRGIKVIPVYAWDLWIDADFAGVGNAKIVFTSLDNHVLGFDSTQSGSSFDMWYDKTYDVTRIRAKLRMGYNLVHGGLTTYCTGTI